MPSIAARRALVTLLQTLARLYGCRVTVTRDSPDDVVKRAYRTVSKKPPPYLDSGELVWSTAVSIADTFYPCQSCLLRACRPEIEFQLSYLTPWEATLVDKAYGHLLKSVRKRSESK